MTTYSSDKAVPYVYICTHKETNQFYIGYRMRNVKLNIPSHLDLPEYKTSSTTVRPDWENYTWTIVAEFFDPSDAYIFEQHLIFDNWKNPLLLNGHYNLGENQFRTSGPKGKQQHLPWNKGISTGPLSDNTKQKISNSTIGKPNGREGILTGKQQNPSGPRGPQQNPHGPHGKQQNPHGSQRIVECPHCGKTGGVNNMTRHHFDKCKKKPLLTLKNSHI